MELPTIDDKTPAEDESLSASLDAAWDAHERAAESPDPDTDTAGEGEADTAPEPVTEPEATETTAESTTDAPADTQETKEGPPVGLSAEARELWAKTPKVMRAEIAKREKDFAVGLQKNAEWATRAQQMDKVLQPFQPYLAMNGGAQAIPAVLQTAMTLQMGSPQQRAQTAAQLINDFGVDISLLDNILSGQAPQAAPQMSENERWIADFRAQQEAQAAQQQQQAQQQINAGVAAFMADPKNEFARDVTDDMADLMEIAARRNVTMTLEQAYERACQMRPDIARVINGRNSARDVQQRRNAGSSIHGTPGGATVANTSHDSIRAAIEDAFDRAGQA